MWKFYKICVALRKSVYYYLRLAPSRYLRVRLDFFPRESGLDRVERAGRGKDPAGLNPL